MSEAQQKRNEDWSLLNSQVVGAEMIPEHTHSGFDAINSGASNACPICLAQDVSRLQSELSAVTTERDEWRKVAVQCGEACESVMLLKNMTAGENPYIPGTPYYAAFDNISKTLRHFNEMKKKQP